jgi:hypothetical protein
VNLACRPGLASTLVLACCVGCSDPAGGGQGDGSTSSADGGGGADGTTIDSSGPACTPPAGGPPAGSPVIVEAPSPVAPGQVALLFGAKVGAAAQVYGVRLADGDPGLPPRPPDCVPATALALDVLQAADLSAKAVIPGTWTPGLYALTVQGASGASAPVVLNRPRIDWVRGGPGGVVVSSGTVDVYGRSFGPSPLAWLVDPSGKATALAPAASDGGTSSDGYAASFTVPALAPGPYQLYLHSRMGGASGFSDPLAVTVAMPAPWPTTVYEVAPGSGNDDAAVAAAIKQAQTGGGGIVELVTGSYTLTHGVVIPPKTVLRSATGKRSDVTIAFNEAAIPFPYGFAGDADFAVESMTVTSSTSARLFQCPTGADFMRDPESGAPQYQRDPPCKNARLHDVSFTLTTLRDRVINDVQTTQPASTILAVVNGDDCEISDSSLVNKGGSAVSLAKENRLYVMRNTLVSGTTRVPANQAMPLANTDVGGGGCGMFAVRDSAIVGNTIGPTPDLGAAATMFIEYDAHDLYIADNTIGPNLSNYGEGFSFDAPYYPSFIGIPTSVSGRTLEIPRVLNAAGKTVFQGPADGQWPAATSLPAIGGAPSLVGSSVVVVNGTGLGQYAEVVSNAASAADGTTQLTVDRDWRIALDATSVIEIATLKSKVVFARNTFHDVAVGAQLYAGGYDFVIDGNKGGAMEGTYCYGSDFMSSRGAANDLQRRFSRCYFDQFIDNTMDALVDSAYPWAQNPTGGVSTPYTNGLVGVHVGIGPNPLLPPQRGQGAVGNILRGNQVSGFTFGFAFAGGNGPMPSPLPLEGRDNVIEDNQTQSVPIGVFVEPELPGTLVRNSTCTNCTTAVENPNDGG